MLQLMNPSDFFKLLLIEESKLILLSQFKKQLITNFISENLVIYGVF